MQIRIRPGKFKKDAGVFFKKKPVLFAGAAICLAIIMLVFFSPFRSNPQKQKGQTPSAGIAAQGQNASAAPFGAGLKTGSQPGSGMSLEIIPAVCFTNSVLHLVTSGFSLPDARVEWTVNGVETPAASPNEFEAEGLAKGDQVQAEASINGAVVKSQVVTIADVPPKLTWVKLMPETFKPGDNLYVDAKASGATDIVYEWSVNGNFSGNSSRLQKAVKRGDRVTVKITACNGRDCAQPLVLQETIENMPPMFSRQVTATYDGSVYTCRVQATDPDNDPLTYSLAEAPPGMGIDNKTGIISWKPAPGELKTSHDVTAIANDGHGGTTRMTFTIKSQ